MNKNRIYIILFILMAMVAGYFLYTNSKSTIRPELSDFAVADTSSIDKIFMADRQGKTILLERKSPVDWIVNGKFHARHDLIANLLYTIKSVEVRSPVGKNLYNQTMKLLASNSVKVEIYSKQKLIKTYYVGHPTMDNLGTFMYLEGSSVPFIMNIPGFNGYLTSRYTVNEKNWKSKSVFEYNPRSITKIKVFDPLQPDSSFILQISTDSSFSLLQNNGAPLPSIDLSKVGSYLTTISNISFEITLDDTPDRFRDSLINIGPFKTIAVTLTGGQEKKVSLFRKKYGGETMAPDDDDAIALPFDPDRFYLLIDGDSNWYVCQYYQWNKLLKTPSYFIAPAGAK